MKKPYYFITHLEVPQRVILNIPLNYLEHNNRQPHSIWRLFQKYKHLTGYTFDNTKLKWSNIYGWLFAISIYKDKNYWTISVWDQVGNIHITRFSQKIVNSKKDKLNEDSYNILRNATMKFTNNIVCCSKCHRDTNVVGNNRKFYAGIYCEDCWEGGMKQREARENYN